jgi:ketosteroid isomerase-like protein
MRRFVFGAIAAALVAVCLSAGRPAQAQTRDEQEIRALESRFAAAFNAKDLDAIMKFYVPGNDLFVFDVGVPRQHVGWEDYKKDWQDLLAMFSGPIKFEISDLSVASDGKIAYGHSIQHVWGKATDGSTIDMTVRVTDVYRKIDGKWLIVQEHVSVPIDFSSGKPVPDMMSKP